MPLTKFTQFLFVLQLFVYSTLISAVIKYLAPLLPSLNDLSIEAMNAISLAAISLPIALFAFVLWIKRY
ncbi:hypothetical protein H6F42_16505 [Pseudanabaena sp. FACHB-1998]|uniref:hypothetical protein n=1 Tax=Pseudanabaena sp. FACHB-1998 TaxID=2692858 RepID=UPI0016812CC9|nr:hypothetical protein [Pseudanabaena sp. FACHB-1998]MBD2178519.1 hypothetical protein [Pseudanabaena sp. FACHB-1998]